MGSNYISNPLTFLIETLFGLYIMAFMLRFLLAQVRADFYNPVSQFLVKITNPILVPLRRIIPSIGKFDTSTMLTMFVLQVIALVLILLLANGSLSPFSIGILAVSELLELFLNIFLFAILIQVIISWINPGSYNPVTSILHNLTEPILRPCRQLIPAIGGLDLSPMVALLGIQIAKMLLIPPLHQLASL
jgi:YggT family protein